MSKQIQISVTKAKEMRGTMNTAASFLKELYDQRGQHLWGRMYADAKIEALKRLAKQLDKQIKSIEYEEV